MLKKFISGVCIATTLSGFSALAFAEAPAANNTTAPVAANNAAPAQQQPALVPAAPNLNAKAYVLIDDDSGDVIAEKNMNERRPPASLTKLMTLYLTARALHSKVINLNDKVLVSKKAWQTGGSRMFIRPGQEIPLSLLIKGITVDSGNDATMATAEYVGGSIDNFVSMMNQQAKALGMNDSHFMDPTGLPSPQHYSTALDLAKLARTIWLEFPEYHDWYNQKWLTYDNIRQPNRNRLLWRYQYANGMKTGHTKAAGYCLIAEADKDGMRLISVIMGTPSDEARSDDSIRLLNYGFRFFNTHQLYQAGSIVATPRVWFGDQKTIPAGVANGFAVTLPRGQFQNATVNVAMNTDIQAPVKKGQQLGTVSLVMNGKVVSQQPLVALDDDQKGGWWRCSSDEVAYKFHKWFGSDKPQTQTITPQVSNQPANAAPAAPTGASAAAPAANTQAQPQPA